MIFIIDELDRCKPPFALALLEAAKHFFSVDGVHFVLVTHLAQLANSVRYSYGQDIDAHTYLHKFYNLSVSFPRPSHSTDNETYIKYLTNAVPFTNDPENLHDYTLEKIKRIAAQNELSFREIERIIGYAALAISYTSKNRLRIPVIISGLCALKVCRSDLFEKAKNGTLKFDDIKDFLGLVDLQQSESENYLKKETELWLYCLETDLKPYGGESAFSGITSSLFRYNVNNRLEIVTFIARNIVDGFSLTGD